MDLGLKGKKVVVGGSTRNIGRHIVEAMLAEGASVGIGARNAEDVAQAVTELSAKGRVVGGAFDVTNAAEYKKWIVDMGEQLGGIDVFVHNITAHGSTDGDASWQKCFDADVMGAVRGVETALPFLTQSGAGAIIFIGTTAAIETFLGPPAYNALKASLITYAKQLSQELMGKAIRVNVVSPGPVYFPGGAWERLKQTKPELFKEHLAMQPGGRFVEPAEIANAVTFLASPGASGITGVNLVVDGGYTKRVQF